LANRVKQKPTTLKGKGRERITTDPVSVTERVRRL